MIWFTSITMLQVHIVGIFFAAGVIIAADHEAIAWIRGKKQTLSKRYMLILHVCTWAALLILVGSGVILFLPMSEYLLSQPLFLIKLLLVANLIVNAIIIGNVMHTATMRPFSSLIWQEKLPLFTSGAISGLSWAGALLLGLYLFY